MRAIQLFSSQTRFVWMLCCLDVVLCLTLKIWSKEILRRSPTPISPQLPVYPVARQVHQRLLLHQHHMFRPWHYPIYFGDNNIRKYWYQSLSFRRQIFFTISSGIWFSFFSIMSVQEWFQTEEKVCVCKYVSDKLFLPEKPHNYFHTQQQLEELKVTFFATRHFLLFIGFNFHFKKGVIF